MIVLGTERGGLAPSSAGDERQVGAGAPLGQRAVVQPGVVPAGQRERKQVDGRGDAAAAIGDDRLVRADAAVVKGRGELGGPGPISAW
jgi:hypothetical protein